MKIILNVESLLAPMTGVGRYTAELCRQLERADQVTDLCLTMAGRTYSRLDEISGGSGRTSSPGLMAKLRHRLSRSQLAVLAYKTVSGIWLSRRLRTYEGWLYHSPNFELPRFRGPMVTTVHDLSVFRFPKFHPKARVAFMSRATASALARAAHVIVPSEAVRSELIEMFGVDGRQVTAVTEGASPVFHPRTVDETRQALARHGLRHGQYVLSVATLEPRKNIDRLIDAFIGLPASIRARFPLVLAGDQGWHSQDLHARISTLTDKGELIFTGYLSNVDLPLVYAGARAFAFPSIYEGFGLPVLEAMASGVPVLTSNVSSLPEVAGDAGLLVDPLDVTALRHGIEQVLEDDAWRATAIERGMAIARARTWDRCGKDTLLVYRKVLSL